MTSFLASLHTWMSRLTIPSLIDMILPPRCVHCGDMASVAHKLCGPCWKKIQFITAPHCRICGWPFAFHQEQSMICGACSRQPPLFTQGRSAFHYDDGSRRMIIQFKHHDGTYLAPAFADFMHQAAPDLLATTDVLIPIPLHRWRLFRRQYNQAALLVHELKKRTQIPALYNILQRHKSTISQKGLSKQARAENVRDVFVVPVPKRPLLQGKVITLVDDVWTTGATLTAGCRALLSSGVKEVRVLTLARVIKPL